MQEESISFEEIGKEETAHVEPSSALFKQPIRGRYQSLFEELKARCAPENFMNPYEPEKVSRANELYSEVLVTDTQAIEKLKELRMRATEELGVKFSTELLYEKLTAACNPKNFTGEAYDKERLELANRLYQEVLMNADNAIALEEIEREAKELIIIGESTRKENNADTPPLDDNGCLNFAIVCSVLFLIGLLISIIIRIMDK